MEVKELKELYDNLIQAYSGENLNQITGKLIELYKSKNYSKIREIANKISRYVPIEEEKDARCFSKLIQLYHPDKEAVFRNSIERSYQLRDHENLIKLSHILLVKDIDKIEVAEIDEDVDFNPDYSWEQAGGGYEYTYPDEGNDSEEELEMPDFERSFYNLIKIREYGTIDVEFPSYYLEDFEEFEMAFCGLESLDGIEHCIHIKVLDVSNNSISDLEKLWNLVRMEELYLANNQIGYIDALSNLINLKSLDLSGNEISDISPILDLDHLEFVNLIGNQVPDEQIKILNEKDIVVMTE